MISRACGNPGSYGKVVVIIKYTLSRVVIARVAILLLLSVIRFSRSRLQAVTAAGCFIAT